MAGASIVVNGGSQGLTGANSYSGGTLVSGGTLRIGGSTTPLGSAASVSLAGGNLALIGQGASLSNSTQSYAYNAAVAANTSVSVAGSLAATLGDLSIGTSTLSVSSPDTSGNPYSLAFSGSTGVVTLSGNPTFNVNNSAGGGAGTLALGSFNDNGFTRTITFGGNGTARINSAAKSLVGGTQINLSNGLASSTLISVPPSALVSEYQFAEGSGTTANDNGTAGIAGQLIGPGVGYTTASQVGPFALNFTAANSYVQIPHSAADSITSYTVSAWVNASTFTSGNATIFSTRNGGDTTFERPNPAQWRSRRRRQRLGVARHESELEPSDQHRHLVFGHLHGERVRHDCLPQRRHQRHRRRNAKLHRGNRRLYGRHARTGKQHHLRHDRQPGAVGRNGFGAVTQFLGQIDDVRIYNTALTATEVAQLYTLVPAGVTLSSNNATSLGSAAQIVGRGRFEVQCRRQSSGVEPQRRRNRCPGQQHAHRRRRQFRLQ